MVTLRADVVPVDAVPVGGRRVRFSVAANPERWLQHPLVLAPTMQVAYKEVVAGWSLRTLLANPFYLMMVRRRIDCTVVGSDRLDLTGACIVHRDSWQ
jgi:hypothetical protein